MIRILSEATFSASPILTNANAPVKKAPPVSACSTMIPYDLWMKEAKEAFSKKIEGLNQAIKRGQARQEENLRLAQIRAEMKHFDEEPWQPSACSLEKKKIYLLDPYTGNIIGRKHGREHKKYSYRNLGHKSRKHTKFVRRTNLM